MRLNKNVIVLSGYARGGTNIVWNLLQSHPKICSPVHETNGLFRKSLRLLLLKLFPLLTKSEYVCKQADKIFLNFKMKNQQHQDNKFKTPEIKYTLKEIQNTSLCFKSVNHDISQTQLLLDIYPNLKFIALTRNGYALADGYIRRGKTISEAGNLYQSIAKKMKALSKILPEKHFTLIKFEDAIKNPFPMAERLFSFLDISPQKLDKLRLKSKKRISKDNQHNVPYGEEHRKYWFDKDSISELLDGNINQRQIERLTPQQIQKFNSLAREALSFFNYEHL